MSHKSRISLSTVVLSVCVLALTGAVVMKIAGSSGGPGKGSSAPGFPGGKVPEETVETIFSVNVIPAEKGTVASYIRLNGDVEVVSSVEIYPDTSGKLVKRNVSIGDYVTKDQVLAQIDPSRPGAVYASSPVKATISGTITRLPLGVGENVTTQNSIATVGDLKNLQIKAFIPERFVNGIHTKMKAEVSLEPFTGEVFEADIIEISPVLDSASRTLEISMAFSGKRDGRIKAGMFASVTLYTEIKKNVIQIPVSCLLTEGSETFIYRAVNGKAVKQKVTTGLSTIENVEIKEGIHTGDSIVFRGQSLLSDGAELNIVK